MERARRRFFRGEHETPTIRPIKRIFLATRGEIAADMAATILRRNQRYGPDRQIDFVAPRTFSDSNPIAARLAEANPTVGTTIEIGGYSAKDTYLDGNLMIAAAQATRSDSVFPGYGLLSEEHTFAEQCKKAGLRFIGPPAEAMERAGNKIRARQEAAKIKLPGTNERIPVIPGTGNLPTLKDALRAVGIVDPGERKPKEVIEFPVVLKDPDLGGGKGNRYPTNQAELEAAYADLKQLPNNKQIYMEKMIEDGIHLEIQIIADAYGNVVSLGERDCTIQTGGQKIIEESPSPRVEPATAAIAEASAIAFMKAIKYVGLGTVEFMVDKTKRDPKTGIQIPNMMEVNTRVQVERGVTELRTGVDILDTLIGIAEGEPLPFKQEDIKPSGHVIQTRLYAEGANRRPSGGYISTFRYPTGEGRVTKPAVEEGDELSTHFDSTLKLGLVKHPTREEVILQQIADLAAMELVGVESNRNQLLFALNHPEVQDASLSNTTWFDRKWGHEVRDTTSDLEKFLAEGSFEEIESKYLFNQDALLQDQEVLKVTNKEKPEERNPVKYSKEMADLIKKFGTAKSCKIGIFTIKGVRCLLYAFDYRIRSGTLGAQEGLDWRQINELSGQLGLPIVTWTESGGADQGQNNIALFQMGAGEDAINEFKSDYLLDISSGMTFGGFPAAISAAAKLQMMTRHATDRFGKTIDSRKGITGPRMTLSTLDPNFKGGSLDEMYQYLQDRLGVMPHHPSTLLEDRMEHILVDDAVEAADKLAHILHSVKTPQMIVDSTEVYIPAEKIAYEVPKLAISFDRPTQHTRGWMGAFGTRFWQRITHQGDLPSLTLRGADLRNRDRLDILNQGLRPTAADLIANSGLFGDVVFFSVPPYHAVNDEAGRKVEIEQYAPTIAAQAKFEGKDILILAQQSSRMVEDGEVKRVFRPQRPQDQEYLLDMIRYGESRELPILTLAGTKGAAGDPASERANQLKRVHQVTRATNIYPYYEASVLLDFGGSGGVNLLHRKLNRAAAAEHALGSVADWQVMIQIRSGKWINPATATKEDLEEYYRFIDQHKDANAFGMKQMGLIDTIIAEGPALTPGGLLGAHNDPRVLVEGLRLFLRSALEEAALLIPGDDGPNSVLAHRRRRIKDVYERFSTPNPAYQPPIF